MTKNKQNPNQFKSRTPEFLTKEQVQQYKHDGFIHIPNVLTTEEIDLYLAEAMRMFQKQKKVSWDGNEGNVMDWIADVEVQSSLMRNLTLHHGITCIAEELAGTDLRLLKSELLLKRKSGSTSTPMHIDDFAFPVSNSPDTLTVWVALVDVPVEKGCMSFIPSSHSVVEKTFQNWNHTESENMDENDWEQWMNPLNYLPELNWYPRVTIPIRAGDCTIHHNKTLHSAGANLSNSPRYSLATVYANSNAIFKSGDNSSNADENYEEYNPKSFLGLKNGDHLPEKLFPLVGRHALNFEK